MASVVSLWKETLCSKVFVFSENYAKRIKCLLTEGTQFFSKSPLCGQFVSVVLSRNSTDFYNSLEPLISFNPNVTSNVKIFLYYAFFIRWCFLMPLHSVPQVWVYWGKQSSPPAVASLNAINSRYLFNKNGHKATEIKITYW